MATESIESRIRELGLELPAPPPPVATYVRAVRHGQLVFVSGHGPYEHGEYGYIGKVDSEIPINTAQHAARVTMLNALASLKAEIEDLDRVSRIVKVFGMVNSDPRFAKQPEVINGASDLLVQLFGDRGRHARSAVGLGALPFGMCVEIEMIVAVD